MRFLGWHVEYFKCTITEKGRSKVIEEYDNPVTEVTDALLILASSEKKDETNPELVAEKTVKEIENHLALLGVKKVVLHSFAHLFGELSSPETALNLLKKIEIKLKNKGFEVTRTPFGWFNSLEIKAKGHPLSRIARIISLE